MDDHDSFEREVLRWVGIGQNLYPPRSEAEMRAMQNYRPTKPDLTPKQLDWCRKNIPAFNNRSALAEGPK